jgi:hypothetical protein
VVGVEDAGKTWADDAVIAGLIRALHAVLNPQARLCTAGTVRSKELTRADVAEIVWRYAAAAAAQR